MASTGVGYSIAASQVTVGTSAALLIAGNSKRKSVTILNTDSTATDYVWLGSSSSVTTSNGFRVAGGESIKIDDTTAPIYAIATTASTVVCLLEVS